MSDQGYYIDQLAALETGAKMRRLGWPVDEQKRPLKWVQESPSYKLEVAGVPAVKSATNLLLVDNTPASKEPKRPKGQSLLGWKPTEEERLAMDWVVFDIPKPDKAE